MKQIVVLDAYTLNPGDLSWDGFHDLGEIIVYDRTPDDRIIERIGDAEMVLTNKTLISAQTMDACPGLKYIGVLATGYNVVDIAAAAARNIIVSNIPSYGTDAVAQHAFALLLELCSHTGAHNEAVARGRWSSSQDFCFWDYPLMELSGKTLGIIGMGRIGYAVSRIARAFNMKVLAYDSVSSRFSEEDDLRYVSLDELLGESDIISLHCPLTAETEGLINKDTLAAMRDGALLINTSRGPLIREHDLAEALKTGKIGGAGLDVLPEEPPRQGSPLIGLENCIITPHIAWAAVESRKRLMDMARDNAAAFLAGKPRNTVV